MSSVSSQQSLQSATAQPLGGAPSVSTDLPGPIAKGLIQRDERYCSPTYTRDFPLAVKRASGVVIEDVDGNRFLDFAAGIAVCATGHCHPKVTAAIQKQAASLIHMCGCDFYYPPMVELLEKISSIVPGPGDKRIFLTNSGTEATEGAIKMARYKTGRKGLIAFYGAFHGRSTGSLALTCSKAIQRRGFGPFMPMVSHVPYGNVEAIESCIFKHEMAPDEVAAVFVEAVQGEGGYVVPDPSFLPALRALCDKHGILLVCDEVQSGMGRTGKWFAFEHSGIVPDIVLMSKGIASGMPLGALVSQEGIATWPPGAHGSTLGGNPVSCAAAVATIELIESSLMENARNRGERLMSRLKEMSSKQKVLANPRGLGLLCAIDVINPQTGGANPELRDRILQEAFRRGVLLLGCGETSIRFCPPLVIEDDQLDTGLKVLDEAVTAAG